ncbi:MAG: long-chain fatty acid--CoA ligase [Pseudomonadota bacterium]
MTDPAPSAAPAPFSGPGIPGLMMDWPLLTSTITAFMEENFGDQKIVSVVDDLGTFTYTYAECAARVKKLANALKAAGVKPGDRVATIAFNTHRHFEIYHAVSGMGAVCHTLNPRLSAEHIDYIINHAEDVIVFADPACMPLTQNGMERWKSVRQIIELAAPYEEFIADHPAEFAWPTLDENAACALCYTSGTTGNPKGALYSHRSTVLHAICAAGANAFGLRATDVALSVVPMFHVNGWGLPYTGPICGAKLVLPGRVLDGPAITKLVQDEGVTLSVGVPTVWQAVLDHLTSSGEKVPTLKSVFIGGSAVPPSMIDRFEAEHGVDIVHAWGMTELSPIGTVCKLDATAEAQDREGRIATKSKQGRAIYGIELRTVDDAGERIPHGSEEGGELQARGPWVISAYFRADTPDSFDNGWFRTGDVAIYDNRAHMQITDRIKDVIKSGGEWISSIDIENTLMGHPEVRMAACVAKPDPKWRERPVAIVAAANPDAPPSAESLQAYLAERLPKWQCPDEILFRADLPIGPTGKILKRQIRDELYGDAA